VTGYRATATRPERAPSTSGHGDSSRRLRVVVVLKTSQGGLWTLPHITELRRRGHEVLALLPAGAGQLRTALTEHGVPVIDSAFGFRFRPTWTALTGLALLRKQLRELAPDVLHYHLYASALAARLASVRLGVPRVHMVAGPLYLESPVIRAIERRLVRMDTVTIGGSEFTSRRYRDLGRPAARTPVIPYGVDTVQFRPLGVSARSEMREKLGIAADAFVVIMVAYVYAPKGAVHAGRGLKGHDVLLRAWRRFHAEKPGSHLLLVGGGFDGAGERYRRELMAEFDVDAGQAGVTWVDTTADVRRHYAAADVSVSPSLSDNHGAALEAGAMAVPSIVSAAGGLPETVEPSSGWIVPADDVAALRAALDRAHAEHSTGELSVRGQRARQLVLRRFDRARLAGAVADVIERAAAGRVDGQVGGRVGGAPIVYSVFSEARFGRDADGRWAAIDRANGGRAWHRYTANGNRVRLVVRADSQPGSGVVPVQDDVHVLPMPYYVGLPGLIRRFIPLAMSVRRAVADADRVVLRVPGVIGSLGAVACRVSRRRYAVEVVGDPADVLASGVLGAVGRCARHLAAAQLRWVVRGADTSLFVTRQALQRRYPPRPGTPSTGTARVQLDRDDFVSRGRTGPQPPFRVVTIGSQEQRYKGHDVLLRALRQLLDEGLDVTATVVGGGRMHDELVGLAVALGLADRVVFTGAVHARHRIVEILDAAALFALPSRTEGMPRALIEAMARALPSVATDVGGIPELLDPSCLVPVDDPGALAAAIGRLLSDPHEWQRQSQRNLDVARTFDAGLLEEQFSRWIATIPPARRRRMRGSVR
jgi:glycosyltransferase involved in cell wall biosynthesis